MWYAFALPHALELDRAETTSAIMAWVIGVPLALAILVLFAAVAEWRVRRMCAWAAGGLGVHVLVSVLFAGPGLLPAVLAWGIAAAPSRSTAMDA